MAVWKEPILTEKAKNIITDDIFGKKEIVFTKIEYGSGRYTETEELEKCTAIKEKQQEFPISSAEIVDNEYIRLRAVASNKGLLEGYEIWEIGVFIQNPEKPDEDILFSIAIAEKADMFPADDTQRPCEILQEYYIYVTTDLDVKVVGTGACVTVKDFEEYKKAIQKQFEDLPILKIGPESKLQRKDTVLLETIEGTNKVFRIQEMDSAGEKKKYDLAAVFEEAKIRENIKSEETLSEILGKTQKFFADLKLNSFVEADDPFVLMTEATYKPPEERTKGSLYGFITKTRGLIVDTFNRYVNENEDPKQEKTLYGTTKNERTNLQKGDSPHKGILYNLEYREEGDDSPREKNKIYGVIKTTKG